MSHPCSEGLLSRPSDCRVWAAGLKPVSEARLTLRCLAVPLEGPEWLDTLPFPPPAAASAKHSLDKSFASMCRLLRKQKWWTGLDFRLLWTVRDVFLVCVAMWWRATFSCVLLRVESRDLVGCQQFCFSLPSLSSSEARNGGERGIEGERKEKLRRELWLRFFKCQQGWEARNRLQFYLSRVYPRCTQHRGLGCRLPSRRGRLVETENHDPFGMIFYFKRMFVSFCLVQLYNCYSDKPLIIILRNTFYA